MTKTATKTPTLAQFKQFAREIAPAARAVLMAQAFAELERKRVNAYTRPLFAEYTFADKRTGERITDPKWLYLSEDDDLCADYFKQCDALHREHGFTGPEGHCPALIAENLLMAAQRELLNLASPLFGVDFANTFGDTRKKALDLLIGAALKTDN